jgi:hypothetical protein
VVIKYEGHHDQKRACELNGMNREVAMPGAVARGNLHYEGNQHHKQPEDADRQHTRWWKPSICHDLQSSHMLSLRSLAVQAGLVDVTVT